MFKIYRLSLILNQIGIIAYAIIPYAFNFNTTLISSLVCKIYKFILYGMDAISPWCLVYISVEKFISIAYPAKRMIMKKTRNQIFFIILLYFFNFFYHINIIFSFDIFPIPNNSSLCTFSNYENQIIVTSMDLFNFIISPFFFMMLFSGLLIGSIFKARNRIRLNNTSRESKRLKQDIKFAISLLSMNLLFIVLILPDEINLFFPFDLDRYVALADLCDISFAINFYLNLLTNSLFRREFISLFIKKTSNQTTNLEIRTNRRNIEATFGDAETIF